MTDDEVYEKIDHELHGGDLVRSLWTRVYAEADGDEAKARARYITARAAQLKSDQPNARSEEMLAYGPVGRAKKADYDDRVSVINRSLEMIVKANSGASPEPLSVADLKTLQQFRDEARARFNKIDSTLEYQIAGLLMSKDGIATVSGMIDDQFRSLMVCVRQLPEKYVSGIISDFFHEIESVSMGYLFYDRARPRGGWTMSEAKRAAMKQYNDLMDRKAWVAILYLKLAKSQLEFEIKQVAAGES